MVLAYSADHYRKWRRELGIPEMPFGAFGENLTIEGLTAYEKAFQIEFDPVKLAGVEAYKTISKTPEFAAWAKRRKK